MPNWVKNELKIYGRDLEKVKLFLNGETILDFNKVIPYPEEFRILDEQAEKYDQETEEMENNTSFQKEKDELRSMRWEKRSKDGFNSGGYEWCNENWGTKWNASEPDIKIFPKHISYGFSTAWAPPIPVIQRLSERFPNLFTLKYWEGGSGFKGVIKFKDGYILERTNEQYSGRRGG